MNGSVTSGVPRRDYVVEESFERVGAVSTVAFARWMAGEGEVVAREVGQESWRIFAQLASQREAPLNEVTKRCLRWRDSAGKSTRRAPPASGRRRDPGGARQIVQRSLDVTLVRMCESFEDERQRAQEELNNREKELVFLATRCPHRLPNRTLILDRSSRRCAAPAHPEPVAALFVDLDNFKAINDSLGHRAGDKRPPLSRAGWQPRSAGPTTRELGGDEFVLSLTAPRSPRAPR